MTKICESFAGGFARVGRTLGRRPPQPVEGVSRLQKSADIFISGLLAVLAGTAAIAGNSGEAVRWMRNLQMPCLARLSGKLLILQWGRSSVG